MLNKNISIQKIVKLLAAIDENTDILSIDLSENDYKVQAVYSISAIERKEYYITLEELQKLLDEV